MPNAVPRRLGRAQLVAALQSVGAGGGNVYALAISGSTLYIGGAFQNGAGIASRRLPARVRPEHRRRAGARRTGRVLNGTVEALAVDSRGTLYAGGGFSDLDGIAAAD